MKLSVVTSTYNTDHTFLDDLWQSLKTQQGSVDWQWIIRDDGSDDPWNIPDDNRIKLIDGKHLGRGASMAVLMDDPAIGDWVLHVDADDWLEPCAFEVVAQAIEQHPEAVLMYADHWAHRLNRIDDGFQQPSIAEDLLHSSQMFHLIVMNTKAYRKTEGYNPDYRWSSDYDVWLKLQEIGKFHHIPVQLYHWREHLAQMYHNYRDEQLFTGYKAVKAACVRRGGELKPVLRWFLNPT
jgi:glycosyltransferase involved in cell wall biosynthesis